MLSFFRWLKKWKYKARSTYSTDRKTQIIVSLFKRLKKWNPNAKLRVPYYLFFELMRAGIDREDLEDEGEFPKYDHNVRLPDASAN